MIPRTSILVLTALAACSPRYLAPATRPAHLTPRIAFENPPPAVAGQTQVVVDVVDGPTRVEIISEVPLAAQPIAIGNLQLGTAPGTTLVFRPLCLSPCVVNLRPGVYRLNFLRPGAPAGTFDPGGLGSLEVKHDAVVYRRSLGVHRPRSAAKAFFGYLGVIAGPIMALNLVVDEEGDASDQAWGWSGVALTALGIYLLSDAREVIQPGADLQFYLGR